MTPRLSLAGDLAIDIFGVIWVYVAGTSATVGNSGSLVASHHGCVDFLVVNLEMITM